MGLPAGAGDCCRVPSDACPPPHRLHPGPLATLRPRSVCEAAYALDSDSGACVRCTAPNCASCSAAAPDSCVDEFGQAGCADGFYWAGDSDGCQPCTEGCAQCELQGAAACERCAAGFFMAPDWTCMACGDGDAAEHPACAATTA